MRPPPENPSASVRPEGWQGSEAGKGDAMKDSHEYLSDLKRQLAEAPLEVLLEGVLNALLAEALEAPPDAPLDALRAAMLEALLKVPLEAPPEELLEALLEGPLEALLERLQARDEDKELGHATQ